MITNQETGTRVDEVAAGIYRICTPADVIPGGFTFNSYLMVDEEPLLFHAGLRKLFPITLEAIGKVIRVEKLRWIGGSLDKARLGSRHPSGIGFTCKGKNVSLCNGITQTEAKQIVGAVLHQFPELTQIWGHYAEGVPTTTEYVSLNLK